MEDSEEAKDADNSVTVKGNLELCLQRCSGSYRRGIEIIYGLYKKGVNPKD